MYVHLFLVLILTVSVILDLLYKRIPNWLILIGIAVGSLILYLEKEDWYFFCIDAFFIFLITYILYMAGALGGGDVKLFVVITLIVGFSDCLLILITSFFIGAAISILKIINQIRVNTFTYESFRQMYIHFSIPIFIATIYIHFLGGAALWSTFL